MKKKVERRQEEITQLVLQNKQISVDKLAGLLHVTQETIRRDLTTLEDKGILYRTHGGAVVRETYMDIPMEYRIQENHDVKKRYLSGNTSLYPEWQQYFCGPQQYRTSVGEASKLPKKCADRNKLSGVCRGGSCQ